MIYIHVLSKTWLSKVHSIVLLVAVERARIQNTRDFPQTTLDSEINAPFLLNEHGDPHFLFYKFNENNILNNWEKNCRNLWLLIGKWTKSYR